MLGFTTLEIFLLATTMIFAGAVFLGVNVVGDEDNDNDNESQKLKLGLAYKEVQTELNVCRSYLAHMTAIAKKYREDGFIDGEKESFKEFSGRVMAMSIERTGVYPSHIERMKKEPSDEV